MQGFDEVYNILLEHSFRYFGPESSVTKKIHSTATWKPNIQPDDNNLIKLVDENLRKDNDAYLNFLYVGFYYIFENLLTKVKFENKMSIETLNLDNQPFCERLNEEDFRKVMGFIGNLLITERQSLSTGSYNYVDLYFQIKKIWAILITKRYFDDNYTIDEIRTKMKKSYAIPQLMKIEEIKTQIENHLEDLDKIYETKESAIKHINEFQKDYLNRYFGYLQIGLTHLIKDFLIIISSKFTSIDLLKENLNTIYPVDPFHVLLIEYLQRDQNNSNNLQTEADMLGFLNLINSKYCQLNNIPENSIDNNLENSNESDHSSNQPDQTDTNLDDITDYTTNDNNLHDTNIDNLISDRNVLFNNNSQHQDVLNLSDNLTFGTITENESQQTQTAHIDEEEEQNRINENNELNDSMNENNLIDHNLEQPNLETTELDNQYQQFEILEEIRPDEENNQLDTNESITETNESITETNETNNIQTNNIIINDKSDRFDRVFASALNLKSKTNNLNSKESNKKSKDRQSIGSDDLTELKGCSVNEIRSLVDIDNLNLFKSESEETSESDAVNFHEISNAFIDKLQQQNDSNKTTPSKSAKSSPRKRLIDSDQDELGDLETIKRMQISSKSTTSSFSFDYDPLASYTIPNFQNKSTPTKSSPTKVLSNPKEISISNRATLANTPKTSSTKSNSTKSNTTKSNTTRSNTTRSNTSKPKSKNKSTNKAPKKRVQTYTSSEEEEDEEEHNQRYNKRDKIDKVDLEEYERIINNQPVIRLKKYSKFNYNGKIIPIYN